MESNTTSPRISYIIHAAASYSALGLYPLPKALRRLIQPPLLSFACTPLLHLRFDPAVNQASPACIAVSHTLSGRPTSFHSAICYLSVASAFHSLNATLRSVSDNYKASLNGYVTSYDRAENHGRTDRQQ